MARYDVPNSDASSSDTETPTPFDAFIRPNLARAFALPVVEGAHDERFRLLLDAIGRCCPPNI